jgi:hypothetical protein
VRTLNRATRRCERSPIDSKKPCRKFPAGLQLG